MSIKICNPKEASYGNTKENIFLAYDDSENYIGCSWVYPGIKYHELQETPHAIFININMKNDLDKGLEDEAKQVLFEKVFARAKEIRIERPDLKAIIYAAFFEGEELLKFYIKNGLEEGYGILMAADIPKEFKYDLPENIGVKEVVIDSEGKFKVYKEEMDEIFITPVDEGEFKEDQQKRYFNVLKFYIDGKLQGGCTVFERDGYGVIDKLYVELEARGQGVGKVIINYIFDYFISRDICKTQVLTWELNKRAVNLYKRLGYKEVKKSMMSPWIII